jgi:hypothetical protein
MATRIRVWEIIEGKPVTRDSAVFADSHREDELERWIAQEPDILGEKLLIIAEQLTIPQVGRLDLLGMDASGKLVIIELKRTMAPREAVAQALDYASWLNNASEEEISAYANQYLQRSAGDSDGDLADAFEDTFGTKLPELVCQKHRILLVAAGLDDSAERIVNYLAQRHSIDINAVFFNYCELSGNRQILVRSVLVPESATAPKVGGGYGVPEASLLAMADENRTAELVRICRQVRDDTAWYEECVLTAEGSFRYWASIERVVYGINVSGKLAVAPKGELDVWIRTEALAELTAQPEQTIKERFSRSFQPFPSGRMNFVIRLKTKQDAEMLTGELKKLAAERATPATENGRHSTEGAV